MPKLKTYQICFSKRYKKLDPLRLQFTTARWLDSIYRLGQIYEIFYVVPSAFHRKIHLGSARLKKLEISQIQDLSDEFTQLDADCSWAEFYELMRGWYEQKKDPPWRDHASEIQILYLERVFQVNETDVKNELEKAYFKQLPLEAAAT